LHIIETTVLISTNLAQKTFVGGPNMRRPITNPRWWKAPLFREV